MWVQALVVADDKKENNRIGHELTRRVRAMEGFKAKFIATLDMLEEEISMNPVLADLAIVDGISIGYDFARAATLLPRVPIVALDGPGQTLMTPEKAAALGLDPTLLIKRPFRSEHLDTIIQHAVDTYLVPPTQLQGLLTNRASTNVFHNGRPLNLLQTEQQLLSFLLREGENAGEGTGLVQNFRTQVLGKALSDTDAQNVLDRFSRLLARDLPHLTQGQYRLERTMDDGNHVCACRICPCGDAPKPGMM